MLTGKKPFFWFCEHVFKVKDNQLIEAFLTIKRVFIGSGNLYRFPVQ